MQNYRKMRNIETRNFCISFLLLIAASSQARPYCLNPLSYGLWQATTGTERYEVLMRCHRDAVANGYGVSYKGIGEIELDIPASSTSIPLPEYTDFSGVTLFVRNNEKAKFLFEMSQKTSDIQVTGEDVDYGNYLGINNLRDGSHILIIEDSVPWVKQRTGYNYGAIRKEVFFVKDGKTDGRPIASYRTSASNPKGLYCSVSTSKKIVRNLKFVRAKGGTAQTYCIKVQNQYNAELDNIAIITPEDSDKYGDTAIQIVNCAKVVLNDISIHGTYSQERKWGYGININNVNGLTVNRMYARSKWGVFGTNNLQNVVLTNCDINRFDIHCYGKDIKAVNCKFSGLYNQLASVYGNVVFKKCQFNDFHPLLMADSYNAYTPFDLVWKDCTFNLSSKKNGILTLFSVPEQISERPELMHKCLPNIMVENCKVVLDHTVKKWYLIKSAGMKYHGAFNHISTITMKNVKVTGNLNATFDVCNEHLNIANELETNIDIRSETSNER